MVNFLKKLFDRKPKVDKVDVERRFGLLARVGQGSMSKVWRARDNMTGRMLAVKILDKMKTARFESRFLGLKKPSEGEIAISLQHPNIVHTIEFGTTINDEQYIVMDFVEGVSLSYLVEVQNEQMQDNCLNYIIQLGEALDYLHRKNWIHRDLCPRNVMIDPDNLVKLIDFGLVVPNVPDFQKPGNRTGTANYMAPELIKRQRTDQRIDIFSFAVTAYEMYAKRLPWDVVDQATLETVLQHINKPPNPISESAAQIDPRVADVIMQGLRSNPAERWQTMSEMLIPLRKAHEEIEAKKQMGRKLKAAAARAKAAKSAGNAAAIDAKSQKTKEDDAFFEQILFGEGTTRKDKTKPQTKGAAAAKTAHDLAVPKKSQSDAEKTSKLNSQTADVEFDVPNSGGEDEFDGIEIEEEGQNLSAVPDGDETSDEFAGIEIEVEGELPTPAEVPAPVAETTSPLTAVPDNAATEKSPITRLPQPIVENDDEPVLRLPDDD